MNDKTTEQQSNNYKLLKFGKGISFLKAQESSSLALKYYCRQLFTRFWRTT